MKKFESVLDRVRARAWSQVEAAEILGMSERTFRHWRDRFEADGAEGLYDRRLGKVPARRVPVDTVIGKTRFDLRAPADPTQGAASPVDRRILYVEDNPVNRQLMERVVARVPHMDLITADTAERGLAMIESERPDLIPMDISLPGMDGFEVPRHLRHSPATAHLPVVALSAAAARAPTPS